MKKEDLKIVLSKITPSEELIQATILKVEEQKRKEEKPVFSFFRSFNYRYAAAFCALALVLCVGVAAMGRNGINQETKNPKNGLDSRMLHNTDLDSSSDIGIASYVLDNTENEDVLNVQGTLRACYLSAVTDEEAAEGVIACGILEIAAVSGEESSNISAKMYFYDNETLNALVGVISEDIYFRLVPVDETDGETAWKVIDFSLKAAK